MEFDDVVVDLDAGDLPVPIRVLRQFTDVLDGVANTQRRQVHQRVADMCVFKVEQPGDPGALEHELERVIGDKTGVIAPAGRDVVVDPAAQEHRDRIRRHPGHALVVQSFGRSPVPTQTCGN